MAEPERDYVEIEFEAESLHSSLWALCRDYLENCLQCGRASGDVLLAVMVALSRTLADVLLTIERATEKQAIPWDSADYVRNKFFQGVMAQMWRLRAAESAETAGTEAVARVRAAPMPGLTLRQDWKVGDARLN